MDGVAKCYISMTNYFFSFSKVGIKEISIPHKLHFDLNWLASLRWVNSLAPYEWLATYFIPKIMSSLNEQQYLYRHKVWSCSYNIHDRICYNSLDLFIGGTWRYSGFDWRLGPGPQTSGKLNRLVQNNEINVKSIKDWSWIQCLPTQEDLNIVHIVDWKESVDLYPTGAFQCQCKWRVL